MITVEITRTATEAALALAALVAGALRRHPALVVGLPTGRTVVPFYAALVERHRAGDADFARARTFNLDEFSGLAPGDPRSYHAFMRRHLFSRVNLRPDATHVPDGSAADWRAAARRYEAAVARAGGLDLCCVGIGENGHVAFNEPADRLAARTHRARLTRSTRRANAAAFGGRLRDVPTHALTMGMSTMLEARTVVLIATGGSKAGIVARALAGAITTRVPASLLQLHPRAIAILDRAAAARLR